MDQAELHVSAALLQAGCDRAQTCCEGRPRPREDHQMGEGKNPDAQGLQSDALQV